MSPEQPLRPGRRLAGRYVLEQRLAQGGMATVWRGRDEVLARTVAVKILREDADHDPVFGERFRREAMAAARLSHPNIVRIFDTGHDGAIDYIVMEYCNGPSLRAVMEEEAPFEPSRAVGLLLPVLSALAHAHSNEVIHRDVKPANVLVGTGGRVQVTDFGIAKAAFEASRDLTTTGAMLGTVRYLSPEQVQGGEVDARSDVYAVGVVLYEMLTGRPPFQGDNELATALLRLENDPVPPRDLVPGIPRDLEAGVLRALARRPDDRYQSADQMRTALQRQAHAPAAEPLQATVATDAVPANVGALDHGESFLRSWMLVPALLLVVGSAIVVGGMALGRLQIGGPLGIQPVPEDGPASPRGAVRELPIAEAQDFDPEGNDGAEHPEEAALAIDGDPATGWRTERYTSAAFGNLKSGVGLWLDLGDLVEVHAISITSDIPGWAFQLRAGPSPDEATERLRGGGGEATFEVDGSDAVVVSVEPMSTRGILIWLTRLGPSSGGGFAATISEVAVRGAR